MRKKLKITFNSPVTLIFVAICLFATILSYVAGGVINQLVFMTYRAPMNSPMMYIRLLLHVFGHADFEHFMGNVCYILLLGPLLEEKYSSKVLVTVIAVTALITGIVNNVCFANVALCGASGVVFAFILLSSFTSFKEGEVPLTFILVALLFVGQEVVQGLVVVDNVSNMAHIVGGMVGAALGFKLNKG